MSRTAVPKANNTAAEGEGTPVRRTAVPKAHSTAAEGEATPVTRGQDTMIKLYNDELSGNCYKLRLFMSLLQLPYARVPVNFHPGREHKGEAFLRINPLGQLPAIDDDGYVLRDAQAILVYLASRYDRSERWYPAEAATRGRIALWLAVAEDITRSASAARLHDAFGYPFDIAACRGAAHRLFAHIEDHLSDGEIEGRTCWRHMTPRLPTSRAFRTLPSRPKAAWDSNATLH